MTHGVQATGRKDTLRKMGRQRQLYLLLLTAVVAVAIFTYAPLFGWWMAVSDYQLGKPILQAPWAGFKYFIEFFTDSAGAGQVILNTVVMNVSSLVLGLVCWFGGQFAWEEFQWDSESPGLGLPNWWYVIWLPILALLLFVRLTQMTVDRLRGRISDEP